jgi:hypothetical protein
LGELHNQDIAKQNELLPQKHCLTFVNNPNVEKFRFQVKCK